MARMTPIVFLDVDGPLIPFGEGASRRGLDPLHGPWLRSLPAELVWATTWMHDANDHLAPQLGLPQLPVVTWEDDREAEDRDARAGLHWKTRGLVTYAAGRPFVWIDDELTDRDRAWVTTKALLHKVDPRRGLTDADFLTVDAWLRTVQ